MRSIFLTREEVIELAGVKQKSTQLKQLAQQGIEYLIGRDGHPRVLKSTIEERLNPDKHQKIDKEPILFGG
ncbi:MAG: DUF4224 domain-containing protein [Alteromonadales bacterium]|nr:DUF4224 domain-containing protein [Alteromonadales bacterium]MCP4992017.1 DUF4224 domain-containing protein [Colwellia sp.]